MVTMSDVSIAAGVSTATVSRVINHPEIVDTRTRDKVQAAIKALNYRRNEVARGLASQSSRTIGVVVNTFASCLLYTSPSPRDQRGSRMPSSA